MKNGDETGSHCIFQLAVLSLKTMFAAHNKEMAKTSPFFYE
jgi:hypothetical protein